MFNSAVELIIREFKEALQTLYGDRLRDVILYGSYARGDYTHESDIDLMVVLNDEQVDTYAEIRSIAELEAIFLLQYGLVISPLPVSHTSYLTSFGPVYQEARKEGVLV
jgi:predicted nucleotidyltransferase